MRFFEKTCCFTGHRNIPREDLPQISKLLTETIKEMIGEGFRFFGTGGALGFDTLATEAVLGLQREFPSIKLILVLPCRDQTRRWKEENIAQYERIRAAADKVVYTSEIYTPGCMHKRNRYLIDNSSVCILSGICHTPNSVLEF